MGPWPPPPLELSVRAPWAPGPPPPDWGSVLDDLGSIFCLWVDVVYSGSVLAEFKIRVAQPNVLEEDAQAMYNAVITNHLGPGPIVGPGPISAWAHLGRG